VRDQRPTYPIAILAKTIDQVNGEAVATTPLPVFGLFVATGIAFLAFFIRPTDLDLRFGLGVGAIFAAVASQYVVSSSLAATHVLTMADFLHILAFVFIFLSLVESTVSPHLYTTGG